MGGAARAVHNASGEQPSRCDGAAASLAAFAVPGAAFAVSEFAVLQATSAATYFLLVALSLPLEASALSMRSIMGSYASPPRVAVLYSVPVIVLGLVLWSSAEAPRCSTSSCPRASVERVLSVHAWRRGNDAGDACGGGGAPAASSTTMQTALLEDRVDGAVAAASDAPT